MGVTGHIYREALEGEKRSCAGRIEDLERAHRKEVERVRGEEREKGREEREQIKEECHREAQQREMEFRDEMRLVREEGEREKKEAVREEQEAHQEEMSKCQQSFLTQGHSPPPHQPHCRVLYQSSIRERW